MSETKDQAASREMGPCGHPKMFITISEPYDPENPDASYHCTLCAELAASRADAYRQAANKLEQREKWIREATNGGLAVLALPEFDKAIAEVLSLITSTDAAARDERDRRIRLEELDYILQGISALRSELGLRIEGTIQPIGDLNRLEKYLLLRLESLRAPVPAERAKWPNRDNEEKLFRERYMTEPFPREGEPCSHPGCLFTSKPCEGCGRIGGKYPDQKKPSAVPAERAGDAVCNKCALGVAVEIYNGKRVHRYRQQIDKQHDTWQTLFEPCHGTGRASKKG